MVHYIQDNEAELQTVLRHRSIANFNSCCCSTELLNAACLNKVGSRLVDSNIGTVL